MTVVAVEVVGVAVRVGLARRAPCPVGVGVVRVVGVQVVVLQLGVLVRVVVAQAHAEEQTRRHEGEAAPLAVTFSAAVGTPGCFWSPAFAWTFGDGAVSDAQNPAHTYADPGTYPWTLTVTVDGKTCSQAGTVTVEELPGIPGDCDGDGTVSIGEAQKVNNAFLGVASSC